jgi:hypothetical protein
MVAGRAGNLLQVKRHVRLCPEIKLHIGIDRERVEAFLAEASPVTVGSHEPFVDGKTGLFADGALDCVQAPFYFLLSDGDHRTKETVPLLMRSSITGKEIESQLQGKPDKNA